MPFRSTEDLIQTLQSKNDVEATKELTRFFVEARFGMKGEDFSRQYSDGADDGGIDFFCEEEDTTFYVVQSKFAAKPHQTSGDSITHELNKIDNTLSNQNPNKKAEEFVNSVRRVTTNGRGHLEVIWLTTNHVKQSVVDKTQEQFFDMKDKHQWKMQVDFVAFDKDAIERMISDVAHGYIPYTGKKVLPISGVTGQCKYIENPGDETGIYSLTCSVKVRDILSWVDKRLDVNKFLQKNVREYIGETKINKEVQRSFLASPDLFWYKHNGVIIFADSISISPDGNQLTMRNPQIVNGGQTLTALYEAYDKSGRKDSEAEVLVRAYRLPYERTETYEKSIDIIKALNSQNAIRPSDLRSTDPRQVRIESLLKDLGYKYWRKRAKEAKSGRWAITMRNLALYYYVCEKGMPQEGVLGQIEELFDEKSKYDEVFPEQAINKPLNSVNHVLLLYVLVWRLGEILDTLSRDLPKKEYELSEYTRYYVLTDLYKKVLEWRRQGFQMKGWRDWISFVQSDLLLQSLWQYVKRGFQVASSIVPRDEEPRKFFKKKEAAQKFASHAPNFRSFKAVMNRAYQAFERTQE